MKVRRKVIWEPHEPDRVFRRCSMCHMTCRKGSRCVSCQNLLPHVELQTEGFRGLFDGPDIDHYQLHLPLTNEWPYDEGAGDWYARRMVSARRMR